ncbi:MAG TPA: penicillin-binding transpeptidase domain-containing protein, partial [Candidatus Nitrosocosmicus sp.]|nr:penicillin-binding transpeptidase domain-containing protein [Candidatus Nitrosocosmicus sp.]
GNSYNIPAVKMLQMNGIDTFVASAPAFLMTTFDKPENYGLSLTLGGVEVRPTELAQAFSAFANEGVPKKLVAILRVENKRGKVLYEYKDPNYVKDIKKPISYPNFLTISGKRAISKETAFLMSHILLDNNARMQAFGPSSQLVIPKKAVSVKTGTTDEKHDNWTIGYTPNFLTVVWVGNNDNTPMSRNLASGITGAAPIWHDIMVEVLKNQPDLFPRKPDTVVGKQVCSGNGQKDSEGKETCGGRFEYFIKGTENMRNTYRTVKKKVFMNKDTGKQAKEGDTNVEEVEKTFVEDGSTSFCIDCGQ